MESELKDMRIDVWLFQKAFWKSNSRDEGSSDSRLDSENGEHSSNI